MLRSVDWVDGGGAILYHVLHTHYGKKHRMNVDTGRNENGEIVLIDDAEVLKKLVQNGKLTTRSYLLTLAT